MVDEVEIDLERPSAIRDGQRGDPSGCYVQRDMPGMIHRGTLGEPNLADDLRPEADLASFPNGQRPGRSSLLLSHGSRGLTFRFRRAGRRRLQPVVKRRLG